MLWTSGMVRGIADVSQQIDRMTTKSECPCLTPAGQHFMMDKHRLMTGQVMSSIFACFFPFFDRHRKVHPTRISSSQAPPAESFGQG